MILSTLRRFIKVPLTGLAIAGPIDTVKDEDVIDPRIRTAKSFEHFKKIDTETGWDRVKRMFQLDEDENVSPELHTIYNAGFLGLFTGLCYGGFIGSRKNYMEFMERNQASTFESHIHAKKKLQESVSIGFFRSGFRWGWRIGVFVTMYVGISTTMSVYRNKYTLLDYVVGGCATGAIYKWNMGAKGMAAGAIVGTVLGFGGGLITLGIIKLSGTSMEEARYWQYKWKTERIGAYKEGYDKQLKSTPLSIKDKYQEEHDLFIGKKAIDLKDLNDESEVNPKPAEEEKKKEEEEVEKSNKKVEKK